MRVHRGLGKAGCVLARLLDGKIDEDLLVALRERSGHVFVCRDEALTDVAKARACDRLMRILDEGDQDSSNLFASQGVVPAVLATLAASHASGTNTGARLRLRCLVLVIALWLWYAYRTRFPRIFIIGMLIALAGAILLVGPNAAGAGTGTSTGAEDHKLAGDALGLASAVFYAGYQLVIKQARDQYSTARLMAWSTSITAVALLPFALAAPGAFVPATAAGWWPLLGLALLAQIGGQTVIAYASAHLPASLSSVSLLIQPLTATIAAWLIFAEAIGPWQMLGGSLLLWGIFLSKRGSA